MVAKPKGQSGIGAVTLASYFGVSRQIIDRLVAEKVITRSADGRFDLKTCTRAIYSHQRRIIDGKAGAELTTDARRKSLLASASLKRAQERAAEARLKRESGQYVPVETFESVLGKIHARFKATMLALPKQIARDRHLAPRESDTVRDRVYSALHGNPDSL